MKKPLQFAGEAHYIGSYSKGGQSRDYYRLVIDGTISYVYVNKSTTNNAAEDGGSI
ncbi:MAG TPA: hypothetical protein GX528_01370 [Firmicutes bacterium]|nr:hypothetical protein [Bacillota bacterium]